MTGFPGPPNGANQLDLPLDVLPFPGGAFLANTEKMRRGLKEIIQQKIESDPNLSQILPPPPRNPGHPDKRLYKTVAQSLFACQKPLNVANNADLFLPAFAPRPAAPLPASSARPG